MSCPTPCLYGMLVTWSHFGNVGRGFQKENDSRWQRFPENWLMMAVPKNWHMTAVSGKRGSRRQRFPAKLARDGTRFRKNSSRRQVSGKTLMAAQVSGKLVRDGRCFRKTGSWWQFKKKTGTWRQFPENVARGVRCFRKNWLVMVQVSGKLARGGRFQEKLARHGSFLKNGSQRQGFSEKLTHQTLVPYNSPQFHHFLAHNYFEIILASICSLVTACLLMGKGLKQTTKANYAKCNAVARSHNHCCRGNATRCVVLFSYA